MTCCDVCQSDVDDLVDDLLTECWSCSREFCADCGNVMDGLCRLCIAELDAKQKRGTNG